MSVILDYHQAHKERQARLGTNSPAMKREPLPPVPRKMGEDEKKAARRERLARLFLADQPALPCALDDAIGHIGPQPEYPSLQTLLSEVAKAHNLQTHTLLCKMRVAWIVDIRNEFYYRAAKETIKAYAAIGRFCGGRDHSTIMYGIAHYCHHHNLDHPRDPKSRLYEVKVAAQIKYRKNIAELRARNESQA